MEDGRLTNSTLKNVVEHSVTQLLVRCLLGGIFIYAAFGKINDVGGFAESILNYKLFSSTVATLVATILPWLELICGMSLILGIFQRTATILFIVLLIFFTAIVLWAIALGLDISCGCFSQNPEANKVGWMKILQNLSFLFLALFLLLQPEGKLTILNFLEKKQEETTTN